MARYFGLSLTEIVNDVNIIDWHCMYVQALDNEETDRYREYLLAGGKEDDWEWSYPDLATRYKGKCRERHAIDGIPINAGVSPLIQNVLNFFGQTPGTATKRGTLAQAMHMLGAELVELEYDADGNPIIPEGFEFIEADD